MTVTQPENVEPDVLATVAVLTYNGETYLEQILSAVEGQVIDGDVDILVIDSGSTDGTLGIVARHPAVRLHQIPNSEFGHGKTRNLAARLARGEFIAYLTHDAIPATDGWLRELLAPLRDTAADIKAVMGKQIPRPGCFPLLKYEIEGVFAGFGPDFGTTVFSDDGTAKEQGLIDALSFYSDVNSATGTAFLRNEIPYRDVRYSEDMMFGQDIIEAGYKKAYAPRGAVIHSNDLTLDEYGKRMFDETVALRQIGKPIPPMRRRAQLRMTVRGILADSIRIVRDDYSRVGTLRWLLVNPRFHRAKWRAYRAATLVDLSDDAAIRAGSLEHSRKVDPEH
ncbi:glycosyltransferase family 2 protein [Agreia sp. Leaf283]|uniref:glycosyltransferase family 2 protein n=1 Tax=Agreia sp. Leaf283 TaxID=1736321 RepID=UPI0006FBB442|nr:glycosyltransferase family 2 protein [Agreia sp. Leaf283]KQP56376.1 rhamnosyl transferase [Agreia sp. Leaf283]